MCAIATKSEVRETEAEDAHAEHITRGMNKDDHQEEETTHNTVRHTTHILRDGQQHHHSASPLPLFIIPAAIKTTTNYKIDLQDHKLFILPL